MHGVPAPQGSTKLALYGLGNLRDERLGRMFQTPGCVEWYAQLSHCILTLPAPPSPFASWLKSVPLLTLGGC